MVKIEPFERGWFCEKCQEHHEIDLVSRGRIFGLKCAQCGKHNIISQQGADYIVMKDGTLVGVIPFFWDGKFVGYSPTKQVGPKGLLGYCTTSYGYYKSRRQALKVVLKDYAELYYRKLQLEEYNELVHKNRCN